MSEDKATKTLVLVAFLFVVYYKENAIIIFIVDKV